MATKKTTDNVPALRGEDGDTPVALIDQAWRPGEGVSDVVTRALAELADQANNADLPVMRIGAPPVHDFDVYPVLVMDTDDLFVNFTIYDFDDGETRTLEFAAHTQFGERRVACGAFLTGIITRKAGLRCERPQQPGSPFRGSKVDQNGIVADVADLSDAEAAEMVQDLLRSAPTLLVSFEGHQKSTEKRKNDMRLFSVRLIGAPPSQVWDAVRAQLKVGA